MRKLPKDKKVYVIDMGGLEEELCEEATSFIGGTVSSAVDPLPIVFALTMPCAPS